MDRTSCIFGRAVKVLAFESRQPGKQLLGKGVMRSSPAEILTALAALWSRISSAIGRGQAEQAKQQQTEIDAMDKEIQAMKGDKT